MDGILLRKKPFQNEVLRGRGDRRVAEDTHDEDGDGEDTEVLAVAGSWERRLPCVSLFVMVVDIAAVDEDKCIVVGIDRASSFARVGGRCQILQPLIPSFFVLVAFDQTCKFPQRRSKCVCYE